MSKSTNLKTACGTVNRAKLEELQESFETMRLLEAIDLVDDVRRRFCDLQAIRSEILALHSMAHALINHAPLGVLGGDNRAAPIWERATDLELELSDYATTRRAGRPLRGVIGARAR